MTLQPPSVSVPRARATRTVTPGQCLHYVWHYLDGVDSYGLPDANAAYKASTRLHPSSVPPAGVPGYVLGSKYGHVVLMLGGWQCWSTDWPNRGQASEVDVRVLARTWGRRWAGWAEDVAGHPIPGITTAPTPPPPPPAPVTPPRKVPSMHTLVKLRSADAVWLSDLITRRWVTSPAELTTVRASLRAHGLPTTVTVVSNLAAYGVPVGPTPPAP